jgi:hypothetical protein
MICGRVRALFFIGISVVVIVQVMLCWRLSFPTQNSTNTIISSYLSSSSTTSLSTKKTNLLQQQRSSDEHPDHSSDNNNNNNNIPIFYNLYVANASDADRVFKFVTEQLSLRDPTIHYPIFVNTIGYNNNNNNNNRDGDFTSKLSTKISNVIHLQHYDDANEKVTLQALWEYCNKVTNNTSTTKPASSKKVVYLHSKGSYSSTEENEKLRWFLSLGALSKECSRISSLPSTLPCNVCSSRFSPIPHPHTSGNMWLADCYYVSKLLPPINFATRMRAFKHKGTPACTGRMRWAAEHWIHSHPTVKPCDLYNNRSFLFNYENLPDLRGKTTTMVSNNNNDDDDDNDKDIFTLQSAPRYDLSTFSATGVCNKTGVGTLHDRLEEYQKLYHLEPDSSWWGWRFWSN